MIMDVATIPVYTRCNQVDYWQEIPCCSELGLRKMTVLVSLQFDLFSPGNPIAFIFKATYQSPQ